MANFYGLCAVKTLERASKKLHIVHPLKKTWADEYFQHNQKQNIRKLKYQRIWKFTTTIVNEGSKSSWLNHKVQTARIKTCRIYIEFEIWSKLNWMRLKSWKILHKLITTNYKQQTEHLKYSSNSYHIKSV